MHSSPSPAGSNSAEQYRADVRGEAFFSRGFASGLSIGLGCSVVAVGPVAALDGSVPSADRQRRRAAVAAAGIAGAAIGHRFGHQFPRNS